MDKRIENIARVFIVENNKVLLCKVKTKKHWFFPGGHVEIGETTKEALVREIREEINNDLENIKFIGIQENTFSDSEGEHQELNIIFSASLKDTEVACCEHHLEFRWLDLDKVEEEDIRPEAMKNVFLKWLKDGEGFYV